MVPTRIRVGLVGAGRILPAHLRGYQLLRRAGVDGFRITALTSRTRRDAESYVSRIQGRHRGDASVRNRRIHCQCTTSSFQTSRTMSMSRSSIRWMTCWPRRWYWNA